MGQALYRKYRSKTLSEVVGQEHITDTLNNALKSGAISHAYLFTGPRGVGKTSVARILAHEVNGLKYEEPINHLDIIEIDAASNRRIDEIRELRDKVNNVPTSAKYKVYIIDEVHMLTREAFNALLKTLEEPPEHAIFILATTESHKLPDTIVSRTQHFTFKPIDTKTVASHLTNIAEEEGIQLEADAAILIAQYGQGSFRDSISLLDRLQSTLKTIASEDVRNAIGLAPKETINGLINTSKNGSIQELVSALDDASVSGYESSQLASQLAQALRDKIIDNNIASGKDLSLLKDLSGVSTSQDPASALELVLLNYQLSENDTPIDSQDIEKPISEPIKPVQKNDNSASSPVVAPPKQPLPAKPKTVSTDDDSLWEQVLIDLKQKNNALYGIARMADTTVEGKTLIIRLKFPFHLKRLSDNSNKTTLKESLRRITGDEFTVEYVLVTNDKTPVKEQNKTEPDDLKSINDIFGGAEVLES